MMAAKARSASRNDAILFRAVAEDHHRQAFSADCPKERRSHTRIAKKWEALADQAKWGRA